MPVEIMPINDKILIKPLVSARKTLGGILLPQRSNDVSYQGIVEAVGEGRITDGGILLEPEVHVGELVLLEKDAGIEVRANNTIYKLISEKDIICVLG